MVAKKGANHKKTIAGERKNTKGAAGHLKSIVKRPARVKAKERGSVQPNGVLNDLQKNATSPQQKVNTGRKSRVTWKNTLTNAQETLPDGLPEVEHQYQTPVKYISFVVRIAMDESGQPERTEIEHVSCFRKQNFHGLDGESLVSFIKTCIQPPFIPEPAFPSESLPTSPDLSAAEEVGLKSRLIVSSIKVLRSSIQNSTMLILARKEAFILQVDFLLQGFGAYSLAAQGYSYEIKIISQELTEGRCTMVTKHTAKLTTNQLLYMIPISIPGFSVGLYRLTTVVIISAPNRIGGFYAKTLVDVV
jgi:hypothetical protein